MHTNSKSKVTPLEHVLNFAQIADDATLTAEYEAINGKRNSVDMLVRSNSTAMPALATGLTNAVLRHMAECTSPVAIVTQRIGITPGSASQFDLPGFRKLGRAPGCDVISGIYPYPVPLHSDPRGFGIAVDKITVRVGAPTFKRRRSRGLRYTPPFEQQNHVEIDCDDEDALHDAFQKMVEPVFYRSRKVEREADESFPDDWRQNRALHGFVMLQVCSMLPVKRTLVATGALRALLAGELGAHEHRLATACKGAESPVHWNGMVHFWYPELARRELNDITVPLIKL